MVTTIQPHSLKNKCGWQADKRQLVCVGPTHPGVSNLHFTVPTMVTCDAPTMCVFDRWKFYLNYSNEKSYKSHRFGNSSLCPVYELDSTNHNNVHWNRGFLIVLPWSNTSTSLSQSRLFSVSSSRTLIDILKGAMRHGSPTGESIAVRVELKSYSYFQLISSAYKTSNLLCSVVSKKTFGVDKCQASVKGVQGTEMLGGARIGIVAKPSAEFVAGMLGVWLSGGVAVPLAFSYPEAELFHVMKDSDVSMILSTEDHQELVKNVAARCAVKISLIPSVSLIGVAETEKNLSEEIEDLNMAEGEDPALIVYTSGTTGKPKGVVHTHKSILSQVQFLTEAWEYTSADQFLHCLPLHHIH
ncbi:hypothetical protein NE237_027178 [Protea cynaroides]|uniref:AMP-dependent synthetase/ligase domain-containing protein n=1 Tax=Protea cynaroides TaxID=273540 RepID=A0A9Q0GM20_9MAGN|nr:hypothetical protein NE237_027178 [Protea cynaroides]